MRRLALLFFLALAGCANVRSLAREVVWPCSDAHPCGVPTRPAKCTPVQLCGLSADGTQWVCESSDKMGMYPPLCAEDKAKEQP